MSRDLRASVLSALLIGLLASTSCGSRPDESDGDRSFDVGEFAVLTANSDVPDIRDALPDGMGGIWVLSSFDPHVSHLGPGGAVTARFGSSGQGPQELRNPWYLAAHPGGVAVYDAGARRLKVFDQSGAFVDEHETPAPGGSVLNDFRDANHGEPLRVRRLGAGWVFETYSGQVAHSGALWSGHLIYVRDWAVSPDTLVRYQDLRAEPYEPGLQLFASAPLWTVCGDGRVALLNPLDSVVVHIGLEGRSDSLRIPLPLPPITAAQVESWVDRRLELALREENMEVDPAQHAMIREQALAEATGAAAEVQPPTKLLCDPEGRLWVQGFSVETDPQGYGREWSVFEGDRLVASVRLPPRVWPLFIDTEGLVAVWMDDLDVEYLVRVENPLGDDR